MSKWILSLWLALTIAVPFSGASAEDNAPGSAPVPDGRAYLEMVREAVGMSPGSPIVSVIGKPKAKLLSYDELPTCTSAAVRLEEVFAHTPHSDTIDVVYYSSADPNQKEHALSYVGGSLAYEPALIADPFTGLPDIWQTIARRSEVQCLPTRLHFVYIGSRRYREYREGDRAWE